VCRPAPVVQAGQPEQARHRATERREEREVQPVERAHPSDMASKRIVSVPASSIRLGDGMTHSAPGLNTPSAPFTAGGIGLPSIDVPQLLASWMKNSPDRSRRRRKCSRETFDAANSWTSTQTELPPPPTVSVSLHMLNA